ncbi:MAG: isocitrate/isopropylmalate dehydrogenase family protein [Rhodothermales bacterium]|nr:isocitrate/isopropylmalate dehydrogenase family protein [Rhodothermales bacterium]MBO6780610.1 isocitrate/isopropylmalate dehydrogenase family protein [Rhodothermales bacterium]
MAHHITLIPGDGIGPEVTEATVKVLEATGCSFNWDVQDQVGVAAMDSHGVPLPETVLESIRTNQVALKGPVTTPVGKGFKSVNVQLRQKLDLYANVRPAKSLPGLDTPFKDVDMVIFRENTEGLYSGLESYDERHDIADSIARISKAGSERIVRFAFDYAKRQGRRQVTVVHKANILKLTSGMFLRVAREVAPAYPSVEFNDRIVDNMCMQLVVRPHKYDCIVTTNLFGDILSDLAAGLVGGLGVIAGANIGDEYAVFEAVHGSAPDIAGQNKANPTALIRSAEMMLRHLEEFAAADALHAGLIDHYTEGKHLTGDLGGSASTTEFADRLADRVATHA